MKTLNKSKGKKGQIVIDILIFAVILFTFGIVVILGHKILVEYQSSVNSTFSSAAQNVMQQGVNTNENMDFLFAFIIVGMLIVTIITSFMIRSHPIFFILSLIVLIISIILAAIMSNIFTAITQTPELINDTARFTIIPAVEDKLPLFVLIFAALSIIILYAKSRSSG